jgi:mediator of RNA polymerase II transcription subunit 7
MDVIVSSLCFFRSFFLFNDFGLLICKAAGWLMFLFTVDFKKELRSLNRELQLHILELADVLVERPSQYARRVEDISLIFKNLHHLLNSLRPHQVKCFWGILHTLFWFCLRITFTVWMVSPQARATLIHILELQIQRRKQAVEDIKRYLLEYLI